MGPCKWTMPLYQLRILSFCKKPSQHYAFLFFFFFGFNNFQLFHDGQLSHRTVPGQVWGQASPKWLSIWASSWQNLSSDYLENWNFTCSKLTYDTFKTRITKVLIRLRRCAGWSAPLLLLNSRRQVFLRWGPSSNLHTHTTVTDLRLRWANN